MSLFGGGSSGGGSTPNPPPFTPVDPSTLGQQALAADIAGYQMSDADLASRFPGLVSGRNQQMNDAYNQLTGPLDPTVQNQFMSQGLGQAFGAYGGGSNDMGIGTGTAAGHSVATSLANNVQKKQDYDRAYFESLVGLNPQRQFGLSGQDVANVAVANTAGQNAYNQQKYAAQYGNYNAQQASQSQQQGALLSTLASLAGTALMFSDKRLKKDVKDTGNKINDVPIKTFKYKGDNKTRVGVIAQDVQKKKPSAVVKHKDSGMLAVNYAKLLEVRKR